MKPQPLSEKELLKILRDEESDAVSFYSSEIAKAQAEAMERYFAKPYGDEIEGWSQVLTQDVADTIDWIMPDLRRVFLNSEDLLSLKAKRPSDKPHLEGAATYLQHVFFEDNDGDTIVRTFAFDGLLQKLGVISVNWEPGEKQAPKHLQGVTAEQLVRYTEDEEYEITEQEESTQQVNGEEVPVWELKVVRTPMGRCLVENVPPEQFRVSRRARSLPKADYVARHREEYVVDLARMFPEKRRELLEGNQIMSSDHDIEIESDIRREERFEDEPEDVYRSMNTAQSRKKVTVLEEYIRVDADGDEITELLYVKRVGQIILEQFPVEYSEFAIWSPIFVAHKMIGQSVADRMIDIQKIRTVTIRGALDNMALSLRPRTVANRGQVDNDSLDALLDHEIGGLIEVDGDARSAVTALAVPDMSGTAFNMLEYWDQELERRSGVTRHSQGLDPEALTKTMGGQAMLQNASASRKEDIADLLAGGLEAVFALMLKVLCANQDHSRIIEINEEWVEFDPRSWADDMVVNVHPAQGTGSRETQVKNLIILSNKQEQLLLAAPDNPVVTLKELQETYSRLAEAMGFKNPTTFFQELPEGWKPEPKPDPEVAKAQADAEIKKQIALVDAELEKQKQQTQAMLKQQETEANSVLKMEELKMQFQLKREQMAEEIILKREQLAAELVLQREFKEKELDLKRELGEKAASMQGSTNVSGTSQVRMGGDAG